MPDDQLALFHPKKYKDIIPPLTQITPPAGDHTVLQTLPAYHAYLRSGDYSKYTPDDFTSDVKKFGLFLKGKKVSAIRPTDIQQWIGELRKVLQEKTVSRKIAAITNYFTWLARAEVLSVNPAEAIRYTRVTSPLPDILFEEECQSLKAAASADPRSYLLIVLLLETGLKKEELFGLRLTHFDFSNTYAPELWVKHAGKKVRKDRKLKLPPEIVPVYRDYVQRYHISDALFPYTPRRIEMILAEIAKQAKIRKKVTAGILRDTCAVRQIRRGEGIERVLTRLGLSETTWEDAKIKYQELSAGGI
jgi:site-specific recombinase XerD